MSSIQVLFIDDEPMLQQFAQAALSVRGISVHTATNTVEADRILEKEIIDVIVCDILMPEENGLTYLHRLRQRGRHIPVILLSALGEADVVKQGIDSGAADFMIKPFETEELYQRILTLVDRQTAPRVIRWR
jgi:two-component system, OmpR family, phosphate regulon response regulator OmpR